MAVQPNGKIVVVGGAGGDGALIRFDGNGAPDTGVVMTALGSLCGGFAGVALQADGKIVAAGNAYVNYGSFDFGVAR